MAESKSSELKIFKVMKDNGGSNEKIKNCEKSKEVPAEEIESNLQTPLMFSRCSSLGSLSGFEQHSVHDDHSSIVSDFSPRASGAVSPLLNQNELFESNARLQMSRNNSSTQAIQQKMQFNGYLPRKKVQSLEKLHVPDNTSFQYDTAFKKPYFLKHSVFEDDIAAFKDESSPNLLSTAASSLSSLTIDDDDYGDNVLGNKAGLIKRKSNISDISQIQKTTIKENGRQEPIGGTCEPLRISKTIETKNLSNNQYNKFAFHSAKQQISDGKLNTYTYTSAYEEQYQKEQQRKINWTSHNHNHKTNSIDSNSTDSEHPRSMSYTPANTGGRMDKFIFGSDLHVEHTGRDKIRNTHQGNQIYTNDYKSESDFCNKYTNKGSKNEGFYKEQELVEKNRFTQDSRRPNIEINHHVDENNDLNAYEEQLLDQCIRRGIAKVTKQNINNIKPFCWDLNQICLTTRVILKTRDDDVIKDSKDECNKRHISRGLTRRMTMNSRTK